MEMDTIAAISTGMTSSGIGIVRISGPDSFQIARQIFINKSHHTLDQFESHHAYYGFICDEKNIIDEVLLLPMKSPNTFTMEDTVEIDCHGGILVMRKILQTVIKYGARIADPGEFTKRAFLNGRIDLSRAEAVIDVIQSKNEYMLKNSVNQLTGKLYEELKSIRDDILYEIAFIESALDDPEHISLDGYPEKLNVKTGSLIEKITKLSSSFREGKIISEGINTVIIGKPNVGKSSLLNVLLGENRAIVTDIAGTTRDAIEETIVMKDILLNIVDTAGIRETDDVVEKIGVDKAKSMAHDADLILLIIDSSSDLSEEDYELFDFIKDKKAIILLNKVDLIGKINASDIHHYSEHPVIEISAREELGIEQLKNQVEQMFLSGFLTFNDEVTITNERHKGLLYEAEKSLKLVLSSIDHQMPEDFFSIDLMNAYDCLGRIIGEQIDDDVVNEIFSKFCMGK